MGEEHQTTPFLRSPSTSSGQLDGSSRRTGTFWTTLAHIITAVIGSGALSLAWSISQLGWIAGPLAMLAFAGITTVSSCLLSDCYRPDDAEIGVIRNRTYMDAVMYYLGKKSIWVCGLFQQLSLYGTSVAYVITSSTSMSHERLLWKLLLTSVSQALPPINEGFRGFVWPLLRIIELNHRDRMIFSLAVLRNPSSMTV